jgi:hypothetical protein
MRRSGLRRDRKSSLGRQRFKLLACKHAAIAANMTARWRVLASKPFHCKRFSASDGGPATAHREAGHQTGHRKARIRLHVAGSGTATPKLHAPNADSGAKIVPAERQPAPPKREPTSVTTAHDRLVLTI